MEKKEIAVYLYLGVLIVASLLAVYFFNLQLTGFAVVGESGGDFNVAGMENVFYDENLSAIVLSENQTTGTYTSNVLDAGNNSVWNNLTWEGIGDLEFELRVCSDANCSNASFASVDISNINLTGRYFQYKALFDSSSANETLFLESVSLDYSVVVEEEPETLTITILEPLGQKDSASSVPLSYTLNGGENYTCWYNVRDIVDNELVTPESVSIPGCTNNLISDIGDGDYTFNLFVNSSIGLYNKTSSFSITSSSADEEEETEEETEEEVESAVQIPVTTQTKELSLQNIGTSTINPSDSRNYDLIATNTGDVPLSACALSVGGDFVSWISISGDSQNVNAGEGKNFAFTIAVPEDTVEGNYAFPVTIQCAEITRNSEFSVDVVEKRVEFNITDVERTRSDRVVVSYDLEELLNEEQTVELQFFLYDSGNVGVGNASVNQTLSAGESDDFNTNIAINESLGENMTLTLSANVNAQQYSVSVREPITLTSPTGLFVLGEDLGTTGNVLAIIILIVGGVAVFFFLKRKNISKKLASQ